MCRLLAPGGAVEGNLRKLWVYFQGDTGCVPSHNAWDGWLPWVFHVAPVLDVKPSPEEPVETWVIDPALFPETPVLVDDWVNYMVPEGVTPRPTTVFTDIGVFLLKADGTRETDPEDEKLKASLETGRRQMHESWTEPEIDGRRRQPPYMKQMRGDTTTPRCE
jgi:hypothetical protein